MVYVYKITPLLLLSGWEMLWIRYECADCDLWVANCDSVI